MTAHPSSIAFAALSLCFGVWALAGCGRGELTGPPQMRLGREECAACGMLVNEDRCSCALLIERDRERLYAYFDDLGCMMDYEYDHADEVDVLERYVRDYQTRAWLSAEGAVIARADREALRTPMGSGTVAFSSAEGAQRLGMKWEAGPMDYRAAFRDRREWMWAHYGKPDGARAADLP